MDTRNFRQSHHKIFKFQTGIILAIGLLTFGAGIFLSAKPALANITASHPTDSKLKVGAKLTFDLTWFDPNPGDTVKAHVCMLSSAVPLQIDRASPGGSCSPERVGSSALTSASHIKLEHIITVQDFEKISCNPESGGCTFKAVFIICDQTGSCSLQR